LTIFEQIASAKLRCISLDHVARLAAAETALVDQLDQLRRSPTAENMQHLNGLWASTARLLGQKAAA
jgi:hypothetical protein